MNDVTDERAAATLAGKMEVGMNDPDFIVIGAMKCGTSTVCDYFEGHPQAFMVPGRDPNYFSHPDNYAKGPDWYRAFFEDRRDELIVGEGSNDYASGARFPLTARRIAKFNPDMRIVYMVRHPVKRMVSAWVQNRVDKGDDVPPTLDEAVATMPEFYVDQSLYGRNLALYREVFPDEQIFVGFMEDMAADPEDFFRRLTGFLGIEPRLPAGRDHLNPSRGKRVPSQAYTRLNRSRLTAMIKPVLPRRLRLAVKSRVLSRKLEEPPELSPRTRAKVLEVVRPDAERFLADRGRQVSFWKWD